MNFFLPRTLKLPFYFVLAVGLLLPVPSRGQDADQATFIINANIEKLHAQLAKLEIDLNELFQTSEIPVLEAIKLSEVKSIRGEVSTPRPMEQRESERVPSDFRFLVEFKTEQACAKIIEFMEDRGTKEQINGQTCFTSPDGEFPVMVKVAGAAKLEYGTVDLLKFGGRFVCHTRAEKKGQIPTWRCKLVSILKPWMGLSMTSLRWYLICQKEIFNSYYRRLVSCTLSLTWRRPSWPDFR